MVMFYSQAVLLLFKTSLWNREILLNLNSLLIHLPQYVKHLTILWNLNSLHQTDHSDRSRQGAVNVLESIPPPQKKVSKHLWARPVLEQGWHRLLPGDPNVYSCCMFPKNKAHPFTTKPIYFCSSNGNICFSSILKRGGKKKNLLAFSYLFFIPSWS